MPTTFFKCQRVLEVECREPVTQLFNLLDGIVIDYEFQRRYEVGDLSWRSSTIKYVRELYRLGDPKKPEVLIENPDSRWEREWEQWDRIPPLTYDEFRCPVLAIQRLGRERAFDIWRKHIESRYLRDRLPGLPRDWKWRVIAVYEDCESCQRCGSPLPSPEKPGVHGHIHHKKHRREGGDHALNNLVLLCEDCHAKEHFGEESRDTTAGKFCVWVRPPGNGWPVRVLMLNKHKGLLNIHDRIKLVEGYHCRWPGRPRS